MKRVMPGGKWRWAMMVGVSLLAVIGCSMSGPKIDGTWSEPGVAISGTASVSLQSGDLLVYFYVVSQEAKLKNPRVVWKGTAWENTISEAHHRIAEGWEIQFLPADGSAAVLLPITDHVTHYFVDGDTLYLKSTWSYYSEDGLWAVDLNSMETIQVREEMPDYFFYPFKEIDADHSIDPGASIPRLTPRLLKAAEGRRK